ncbi:DUF4238 domain-containing protein [Tenacibaculum salmonis]|uniref:DUF4238 domain-containing protein n=1 Tax=Tenacibaculum sp. P3-BQ1 TaxID=3232310 RepID=UPI0034DF951D
MSDIKKRQHYVWRHYLRNWSDKENIWTFFKELDKIEKPGLMGVALEKYFYKLIDFTDEEESFLKKFLEETTPKDLKGLVFDYFTAFTSISKLKKLMQRSSKNKSIELTDEIKKLEINAMEDAHSLIENTGHKLIRCESLSDLKSLENEEYDLFGAIMFLSFQYFRTKKMKTATLKSFKGDGKFENLAKKCWNIISYQMSTKLAKSICLDRKLRFVFIQNETEIPLITGDQPVFNILSDKLDNEGNVTDLELYYPLSPKRAIRIHFNEIQTEKFIEDKASKELIIFLNKKVVENSSFYVFSDNKETLELIKTGYNTV